MVWERPTGFFRVEPPNKGVWGGFSPVTWQNDPALKNRYGVALASEPVPFNAGCKVFPDDANKALWISHNWLDDPAVIAARKLAIENNSDVIPDLLDKRQLANKVLQFAESSQFEGKDRLGAFKLYSEICGFTGRIDIDASSKTFTNNSLKIVFVKPDNQNENTKTIDSSVQPDRKVEKQSLPLNIKLVK